MKIRNGFVSNSSSSSFIIINKTNNIKTMAEFVKEMKSVIEAVDKCYDWNGSYKRMLTQTKKYNHLLPGINKESFGDENGNTIGRVFDYGLRDIKHSKSFSTICTQCHGGTYSHVVRIKNTSNRPKDVSGMLGKLTADTCDRIELMMMKDEIGIVAPNEWMEFTINKNYNGNWSPAMHALLLKSVKLPRHEIEIETISIKKYIKRILEA